MDTEQKKEKKPRCPKGTVRNKNGECVKKPEPKAAKEPKEPKAPKTKTSPKPKEPKTVRKRAPANGTLKKYAKLLQDRRKCIQLQFERLV
jgi:hypothetical protein